MATTTPDAGPQLSRRRFTALAGGSAVLGLTAGALGATRPSAAAAAPGHTFTIGSHNVWNQAQDATHRPQYHPIADVIGFQESKRSTSKGIRRQLERNGGDYRVLRRASKDPASQIPIAFNRELFALVQDKYLKTHGGVAKATPSRFVHWAVLEHRATGTRFAFIDTHFVSGAWSAPSGPPLPDNERRKLWNSHLAKLITVYAQLRKAMPVVLVGDMNRTGSLTKHDDSIDQPKGLSGLKHISIAKHTKPIDHLYATRAMATHTGRQLSRHGADHPAIKAVVTLKAS